MTDVVLVVLLLAAAGCARWLLADLRTVPRGSGYADRSASVSVVVPARDEEATLPALLESLRSARRSASRRSWWSTTARGTRPPRSPGPAAPPC